VTAGEDVPAGVEDLLLILVGNEWPGANVAGLRATAVTWQDLATQVEDLSGQAQAATKYVDEGITGATRDAFDAHIVAFTGADGYLPGLAATCRSLANALDVMAVTVETLRNYIIEALVVLALEIAADVAAAPFTFGVSMAKAAVAEAATQVLIMKMIYTAAAKLLAYFASSELNQVGLTFLAQVIEICKHRQQGFNDSEFIAAAENGVIGAAVGFGMGQLGGLLKSGGGKLADSWAVAPGRVASGLAQAGFDIGWGAASGTAEAAAQDAAAGSFGDEVAGAVNGAFSGGKQRLHMTVNPTEKFSSSPEGYLEAALLRAFGVDRPESPDQDPPPTGAEPPRLPPQVNEDWDQWSNNLLSDLFSQLEAGM
jgi:hypothetical protein